MSIPLEEQLKWRGLVSEDSFKRFKSYLFFGNCPLQSLWRKGVLAKQLFGILVVQWRTRYIQTIFRVWSSTLREPKSEGLLWFCRITSSFLLIDGEEKWVDSPEWTPCMQLTDSTLNHRILNNLC